MPLELNDEQKDSDCPDEPSTIDSNAQKDVVNDTTAFFKSKARTCTGSFQKKKNLRSINALPPDDTNHAKMKPPEKAPK